MGSRLHLVTQSGQPYGSVRRCCERCGQMCWRGMKGSAERWTDDPAEFAASALRCDRLLTPPSDPAPSGQAEG